MTTRIRGETQRISSIIGDAASADATTTAADATTTERDDDSVDERGRYDESPTATGRFRQQQYD